MEDAVTSLVLLLVAFSLALAGLRVLVRSKLRGRAGEAQVGRLLDRLFPKVRHDILLPDGRGGLTQLDHVALSPSGLVVVETKHYRGRILGRPQDATWNQVLGRKTYPFQNPLRQNHAHVRAVQSLGPGSRAGGVH